MVQIYLKYEKPSKLLNPGLLFLPFNTLLTYPSIFVSIISMYLKHNLLCLASSRQEINWEYQNILPLWSKNGSRKNLNKAVQFSKTKVCNRTFFHHGLLTHFLFITVFFTFLKEQLKCIYLKLTSMLYIYGHRY